MTTGWQKVDGTWYYLNSSGAMETGWIKSGDYWYYLSGSGAMRTGWVDSGGKTYYMSSSGAMETGWARIDGEWYYFDGSGAMQIGWQKIGGKWYYFDDTGVMLTGWHYIDNAWYELYYNGGYTKASQPSAGYQYTEEDYLALYQPILENIQEYYEKVSEYGYLQVKWQDYGVSECCTYIDTLGYKIEDIDGNGIEELVIGSFDSEDYDANILLYVYTIENGEAKQVVSSWPRSRNYLMDDGNIYNEGSNGAAYTLITRYSYSTGTLSAFDGLRSSDNYVMGNPVCWYRTGEVLERYPDELRIPDEEAMELWEAWKEKVVPIPDLIPFAYKET